MTTLFIADLHLSILRPDITECFLTFMRDEASQAEALYVLGDLFEFWIGDDDNSPFHSSIKEAFMALTQAGVACYFIQGNRDFLLGKRFCKDTGITLLPETAVIDLYGVPTVILHGDTLCTMDEKYQEFRKTVHKPWLQAIFNRIPLFIRRKIVSHVQSKIRAQKQTKQMNIMDVTPQEVITVLENNHVIQMIHGHTHRPNIHQHSTMNGSATRIVLGDWYTQGSILVCTPNGNTLTTREF
ncbi:UDP-2,3-diacylglucosamine diphosphatase [Vibrio rumoiensis]|uniref:UDP-2,3-diacylglucosamine hydrolase n=1 Tax=Vibrio rumoiensis 1S-45 TaxID=1188252 RepID=A0A1E5E1E0_9VIBR|nr:UDP-2,3-diacylglucosamine diphosphatase [Vibrio rumoiensis]OEF24832.1 UDP-2,3-diacylglucosamine diphosphatase [Vibrio rumoiensis 1S-45]